MRDDAQAGMQPWAGIWYRASHVWCGFSELVGALEKRSVDQSRSFARTASFDDVLNLLIVNARRASIGLHSQKSLPHLTFGDGERLCRLRFEPSHWRCCPRLPCAVWLDVSVPRLPPQYPLSIRRGGRLAECTADSTSNKCEAAARNSEHVVHRLKWWPIEAV